jgi:hypothetical protein
MQNFIVNNVLIKEISLYYGTLFLTEGEDTEMLIEHETNIIPLKNDVMFGIEFSLITDDSSVVSRFKLINRTYDCLDFLTRSNRRGAQHALDQLFQS